MCRWWKFGHILGIWLMALVLHNLFGSLSSSKLMYEINEKFQNVIDTGRHAFQLPTFDATPPYFVIGGIFSLSFPDGSTNPDGYQNVLALQCAVADMNIIGRKRGIPTQWFYQIFNDKYQAAVATRAAIQLLEAGVGVTLGPSQADAALAVTSLSNAFNITKVAGIVSIDALSDRSLYGSFFRTIPPDRYAARIIGNIMIYFNWTLTTPIFSDDAYGSSGRAAYSKVATELGIVSTCSSLITPGSNTVFQGIIDCLTSSQSKVVLLWMEPGDAFNVISAFYDSGVLSDLTFMAPASWGDIRDVQIWARGRFPRAYLEGSINVIPSPGNRTVFQDCINQKKVDAFEIPFFNEFLEANLRCLFPNATDPEISSLPVCPETFTERGVFPNLNCTCGPQDSLDDVVPLFQVNYIYDAAFIVFNAFDQIVNNCTAISAATGLALCVPDALVTSFEINKIINVSVFEGITGTVGFNGNDPISKLISVLHWHWLISRMVGIEYDISQRRADESLQIVGTSNFTTNVTIDNSKLIWKNGVLPISAIVPTEITFSDPLGYSALIFIIIALLMAVAFSIYFFLNRREKVIKKTSPFFSQLILLGIFLCVASQIFWDVVQSTFTCVFKVWLLAIGFGLIMGNLLAKTYRIFKIFNNARVTSLVIRDIDLLKFTVSILLIEILMLCLYCFTSGLPTPTSYQSQSDTLLKLIQCSVPSNFVQTGGTILLFSVNFILVLAAVIIAFLTRHVDSAFNESMYIACVVYIYLVVSVVLLPLYYTAGDSLSSQSRQFVIRSVAILVPMFFTLGALFGPKIYLVHKTKKAERKLERENRERDSRRRVVNYGGSTVNEFPTEEGYSTGGGGAFTAAIRGQTAANATAQTATCDDDVVIMPGGSRMSSTGASTPTSTSVRPSTTTTAASTASQASGAPSNEYSNLIKSVTKKTQ